METRDKNINFLFRPLAQYEALKKNDVAEYGNVPLIKLSPAPPINDISQKRLDNWLEWRGAPYYASYRIGHYLAIHNDEDDVSISAVLCLPPTIESYFLQVSSKHRTKIKGGRAINAGYIAKCINPQIYNKAIYEIIQSMPVRQGAPCNPMFFKRSPDYEFDRHVYCGDPFYESICVGVFSSNNELAAYLLGTRVGDHVFYDEIMGHGQHLKHGVMYLLHRYFLEKCLSLTFPPKYLQYGRWYDGTEGLGLWKRRAGYKPVYLKYEKNFYYRMR